MNSIFYFGQDLNIEVLKLLESTFPNQKIKKLTNIKELHFTLIKNDKVIIFFDTLPSYQHTLWFWVYKYYPFTPSICIHPGFHPIDFTLSNYFNHMTLLSSPITKNKLKRTINTTINNIELCKKKNLNKKPQIYNNKELTIDKFITSINEQSRVRLLDSDLTRLQKKIINDTIAGVNINLLHKVNRVPSYRINKAVADLKLKLGINFSENLFFAIQIGSNSMKNTLSIPT
ncbi:hypothetical protein [Enterobacter oligotrophicus]|uniref:hypothetical protein n=1 Tax=Enterobacter oligotrophicus TaxID=2478464 RepID=UPI001260FFB1|nr:hypothetical protein [Enterobacter oligotrophicus]